MSKECKFAIILTAVYLIIYWGIFIFVDFWVAEIFNFFIQYPIMPLHDALLNTIKELNFSSAHNQTRLIQFVYLIISIIYVFVVSYILSKTFYFIKRKIKR